MTCFMFTFILAVSSCETCKDSGKITCPDCTGEFRTTTKIKCVRKGGTGCDARGFRQCFKCRGQASLRCAGCKGSGMMKVRKPYQNSKGKTRYRNEPMSCALCVDVLTRKSTGRVDCPQCHDLYLEQREVGAEIVGQSRPGDSDERMAALKSSRATWMYEEVAHATGRKFVGMIRCPRCMGRGEYDGKALCPSCKGGKVVCPECRGRSAISRTIAKPPLRLTHAMKLKAACAGLGRSTKDSLSTVIDEYMRLRSAIQRFARDEDWAKLIATIEASDRNIASAAK